VESEAAGFLDQMSRYFISRARLVTKVAKYPHVVSLLIAQSLLGKFSMETL
jgi:hypothetical protein